MSKTHYLIPTSPLLVIVTSLFPCLEILQYYNFSDTRDLSPLLYFIDSSAGSDFHHLIPRKMQQTFGLVEVILTQISSPIYTAYLYNTIVIEESFYL